jgi:hypothetical protein
MTSRSAAMFRAANGRWSTRARSVIHDTVLVASLAATRSVKPGDGGMTPLAAAYQASPPKKSAVPYPV